MTDVGAATTTISSVEWKGRVHEVSFAGLTCLAIEHPELGVVVKIPGDPIGSSEFWRRDPSPSPLWSIGELTCARVSVGHCTGQVHCQARFPQDGRVIIFPYVINDTDPRHSFVVDEAKLTVDKDTDRATLKYRVTCPRCRRWIEDTASQIFRSVSI